MFVQMEKRNFMHGLRTLPTLKTTAICSFSVQYDSHAWTKLRNKSAKAKQTSSKLRALFLSFKVSFDTNAMSFYPTKHFLKNCRTVGAIANLLCSSVNYADIYNQTKCPEILSRREQ